MRIPFVALAGLVAASVGLTLHRDGFALYGEPRFFTSQPTLFNRLLHNFYPGDEYIVTTSSTGGSKCNALTIGLTRAAVKNWNDALQTTPNSLSKYPFHTSLTTGCDDSDANIIFKYVNSTTQNTNCGGAGNDACNNLGYPVTTIWVDNATMPNKPLIIHELGHSLWFSDQYYHGQPVIHCADGQIEGGHSHANLVSIMDCDSSISEANDEYQFLYRYKPTYSVPDPTYPDTWASVWNGLYQVGDINIATAASWIEYKYFWEKLSDTNGSVLESVYQDQNLTPNSPIKNYPINLGSRFCVRTKIYNEVGYTGTDPWSPRSQHSCIGAAQSQNADFLLATTDRANATSNTLYVRVKNFSGGFRNVGIFGPSLQNIGCDYQNLPNGSTRQCYVTLTRGIYTHLNWYAWDGSNLSWGYVDFE